jgi:guanine deaminase
MAFILKGNIIYNKGSTSLHILEGGYLVCKDGISKGAFSQIPNEFNHYPIVDYGDRIIIPGLVDLHVHGPQYTFRGMGMDLELLDWLNTYTFKEESNYSNLDYANEAYTYFVDDLKNGATSRAVIYGTIHTTATSLLMEKLEDIGLPSFVGKVNMDRNSPDILIEESATKSLNDTEAWINEVASKFQKSKPILTPRFTPSCSDQLMEGLGELQRKYNIPVQSHLSENPGEIAWVSELCPEASCYGDTYDRYGLFGRGVPTIMAHCVWSEGLEEDLLKDNDVYVAHCPNSNINLSSGIAPIRRFLNRGIKVGLGSDVAGGFETNILRAMGDAIQMSKLYWRLVESDDPPLTLPEALYLATLSGGSFFGKVGSFDEGYEFDAVVIDDSSFVTPRPLTLENRLERIIYLANHNNVYEKYIQGNKVKEAHYETHK